MLLSIADQIEWADNLSCYDTVGFYDDEGNLRQGYIQNIPYDETMLYHIAVTSNSITTVDVYRFKHELFHIGFC